MIDEQKIGEAVASIISAIGEDPEREGLRDTPARVAKMYQEFFAGLYQDPSAVLATGFEEAQQELVVLRDVPFFSVCEHHLLPFYGGAHIGYIPNGRVVGVSKLARALDILAHRPQMQERLTNQFVDTIFSAIRPEGVAAVLSAEHLCLTLRGATKPGSKIVTTASRGSFSTHAATKQEFLALLAAF